MAAENNWLSFSLSSMELMLSSSSSSSQPSILPPSTMKFEASASASASATAAHDDDSHHYYFTDTSNFYGWQNTKVEQVSEQSNMNCHDYHSSFFTTLMEDQNNPPPKLEDFLGGDSTETQDSTLTHLYDQGQGQPQGGSSAAYFSGFPAFSTNSGSEVNDSASVGRTQVICESGNELVYAHCPSANGGLSLAVTSTTQTKSCNQKSINVAAADSGSCKKVSDTSGQRTSIYRGVTRHRWTGRYEAHLWDNSCRREGQARKGRQVYLGGYDKEDKAARAYDLAALKYWGSAATTNLPVSNYTKEIEEMKHVTKQEFIASLRRKSSGFSRGASIYRGVTRHHQQGRWQARIGRVAGNKDLYLGTFATEEEAAEAYDIAAIKFRGMNAVTNFETRRYDMEAIMMGALPIGGKAKKLKVPLDSDQKHASLIHDLPTDSTSDGSSIINFTGIQPVSSILFDAAPPPYNYHHNLFNHPLNSDHSPGTPGISEPMTALSTSMRFLQPPAEFFIWPHQSY